MTRVIRRDRNAARRGRGNPARSTSFRHVLLRLLVLVLALALWQVAAQAHGSVYFPPPGRIAHRAHELWFSGPVRRAFLTEAAVGDVLPSLGRMAAGFAIAAVAGIGAGVTVGRSRRAYALCNPVLQFARAVPPPALVPVFVVVLDFGTPMQIASIAFSAVWPVLVNTAEGVRRCRSRRSPSARSGRCWSTRRKGYATPTRCGSTSPPCCA